MRREALYHNRAHLTRVCGAGGLTETGGRNADHTAEHGGEVAVGGEASSCAMDETP